MQRIAIFASGRGSNAEAICTYFAQHPRYQVGLILCDRQEAGVYDVAKKFRVPAISISGSYQNGKTLKAMLAMHNIHFVLLAGYLRLFPVEVIDAYPGKILNIHPALLPQFGGKGMYGRHVHTAVINAGATESGFTIHLVNPKYDEGKILFQEKIKVTPGINPEALHKLVNDLELLHYAPVAEKYFDQLNQKS
jgi:phosphoribosylglycinamide formyltransferase-1